MDLSHIAPNFAAEPREIKPDTAGSPREISTSTVQDKISIPRPGTEDISANLSEPDINCETDGKQGNSKIEPNVNSKLKVFADSAASEQNNSEEDYGDFEPNDSDLGLRKILPMHYKFHSNELGEMKISDRIGFYKV